MTTRTTTCAFASATHFASSHATIAACSTGLLPGARRPRRQDWHATPAPKRTSRRARIEPRGSATEPATQAPVPATGDGYEVRDWHFRSFRVRYATALPADAHSGAGGAGAAEDAPSVVLVHGFGANCEHWRFNVGALAARGFRVFAMDLLGFGMGDKPAPGSLDSAGERVSYTFDYWTRQLSAFVRDVVHAGASRERPVFLVANSIGCMVTMQLAQEEAMRVAGLVFISPSLRQLNVRKRSWVQNVTAPLLMRVLSYRPLGAFFLESLARPQQLRNVLGEAYSVSSAIDDALVRIISEPAKTDGALEVFLSFIMYDTGPIPEDFLPQLAQPALIVWGEDDRFEPYELGQALRHYSIVERFVGLPGVGHCAHDESPAEVNELMCEFVEKHCARGAEQR